MTEWVVQPYLGSVWFWVSHCFSSSSLEIFHKVLFISVSFFGLRDQKGFCLLESQLIDFDKCLVCLAYQSFIRCMFGKIYPLFCGLSSVSLMVFFSKGCFLFIYFKGSPSWHFPFNESWFGSVCKTSLQICSRRCFSPPWVSPQSELPLLLSCSFSWHAALSWCFATIFLSILKL